MMPPYALQPGARGTTIDRICPAGHLSAGQRPRGTIIAASYSGLCCTGRCDLFHNLCVMPFIGRRAIGGNNKVTASIIRSLSNGRLDIRHLNGLLRVLYYETASHHVVAGATGASCDGAMLNLYKYTLNLL